MTAALHLADSLDTEMLDGRYLGPAKVVRVETALLEAELPGGALVRPQLALAFPFEPACGDTLLVIGQAERHYVIGVIESTGTTHLSFKGDVELRAAGGTLELEGEKGVRVDGPSIAMRTRKLSVVAGKVTEVFGTAFTRVKELLSVRSAKTETLVHGEWSQRAERAAITSEEAVAINGKQIHLG